MSTVRYVADSTDADGLRTAMVTQLRDRGDIRTDAVAQAFLTVPRHVFAPEEPLETAYALDVIRTKFDERGAVISSVSAPQIQALMLEQARIEPGMRVLEVGSGGYQAALLAELVGSDGDVVSVDIDPDIVARAERCLVAAGYPRVRTLHADAEGGAPDHAPFDRIVVTVGAWDIPPAWTEQLVDDGRLVVPLRLRGLTRSIALTRATSHANGCWVSRDNQMCGFVPMQGAGAHDEHVLDLHEQVRLRIDDDQVAKAVDAEGLRAALLGPVVERWSGVEVARMEPFDGLHLWLSTALDGFGLMSAEQDAVDSGLVGRFARWNAPVAVEGSSFAYHALSRQNGDDRYEFGVHAHGPDATRLADLYIDLIRDWDQRHRGRIACIEVHPAGTTVDRWPDSRIIDKRHTRVVLRWPSPG